MQFLYEQYESKLLTHDRERHLSESHQHRLFQIEIVRNFISVWLHMQIETPRWMQLRLATEMFITENVLSSADKL